MLKDETKLRLAVETDGTTVRLRLFGRLDVHTVGPVWTEALASLGTAPAHLEVDASAVEYCDGAGIALLMELKRRQKEREAAFDLSGAGAEVLRLYRRFDRMVLPKPQTGRRRPGVAEHLGEGALQGLNGLIDQVAFLGEMATACWAVITKPRMLRVADTLRIAEEVGVMAVPLIMLLGFVMGLIMAFQSALQLTYYGADLLVANVVGLSLVRELGPMMTAIILTGRSGSAFAAELGAMKVNEEINALTTMGIDPVRFLVVPRLLAALVVTPLLAIFMMLSGLVGGGMVMASLGFPPSIYIDQILQAVRLDDLTNGLTKSLVFGVLVASAGCQHGFTAGSGARAVGAASTGAVVSGIILIILSDGLFAALAYFMGS